MIPLLYGFFLAIAGCAYNSLIATSAAICLIFYGAHLIEKSHQNQDRNRNL